MGDKYMLAGGLPERNPTHAKNIALVALDMIDLAREMLIDGSPVRVSIYFQINTGILFHVLYRCNNILCFFKSGR